MAAAAWRNSVSAGSWQLSSATSAISAQYAGLNSSAYLAAQQQLSETQRKPAAANGWRAAPSRTAAIARQRQKDGSRRTAQYGGVEGVIRLKAMKRREERKGRGVMKATGRESLSLYFFLSFPLHSALSFLSSASTHCSCEICIAKRISGGENDGRQAISSSMAVIEKIGNGEEKIMAGRRKRIKWLNENGEMKTRQ